MIKRTLKITALLFGCLAIPSFAEESCQQLNTRIDLETASLVELHQGLDGISEEFDKNVSDDLWAQVEGAIDKRVRDTAVKTAYVKNRLTKAIDDKTALLATLKKGFCVKCANSPKNEAARMAFCEKCPGNPVCTP